MKENLIKIIGSLKAETVGRCRERIDQASQKAKEIMGREGCSCRKDVKSCCHEKPGVTTILKRRHGL
jgi:hypothetical protein